MTKSHILGLGLQELEALAQTMGQPGFRGRQLGNWVFQNLETDFSKMTNLPKGFLEKLEAETVCSVLKVKSVQVSSDGTTKWALETHDGHFFETVLIPTEDR